MKIFIKTNKNLGICDIEIKKLGRTEECKKALNMFSGRDIRLAANECRDYLQALVDKDEEAIEYFHRKWNPIKEYNYYE